MRWEIDRLKGVGEIVFNQERSDVRRAVQLPEEPRVYAQSEAIVPHDTYEDEGLFVMYDKYNRCGAVEFMKRVEVIWKNVDLFSLSYPDALFLLKQEGNGVVESDKDAIWFDLGIALFAPDKETNPEAKIESITVFRENYFYRKIGVTDPEIFQCLIIQHGFINSIIQDNLSFDTLEDAYHHIFRNNTEQLVLVWNSLPVNWSYVEDIPSFAEPLIELIYEISSNTDGDKTIELESSNIEATWTVKWDDTYVFVSSFWNDIHDGYEQVINQWQDIRMVKSEFLWEWKLFLQQLHDAIDNAGATGVQNIPSFNKLVELQKSISEPGRFYRKEMRELHF